MCTQLKNTVHSDFVRLRVRLCFFDKVHLYMVEFVKSAEAIEKSLLNLEYFFSKTISRVGKIAQVKISSKKINNSQARIHDQFELKKENKLELRMFLALDCSDNSCQLCVLAVINLVHVIVFENLSDF